MNLEFEKKIIHLKDVNSTNEFANKYIDENKIQESFVITFLIIKNVEKDK